MNKIYDDEDVIKILNMTDCDSVEIDMDVGDNMYEAVVEYAKKNMNDSDYFKAGFTLMLEQFVDKSEDRGNGQIDFDFDL
jgi:hypothetical protein